MHYKWNLEFNCSYLHQKRFVELERNLCSAIIAKRGDALHYKYQFIFEHTILDNNFATLTYSQTCIVASGYIEQ